MKRFFFSSLICISVISNIFCQLNSIEVAYDNLNWMILTIEDSDFNYFKFVEGNTDLKRNDNNFYNAGILGIQEYGNEVVFTFTILERSKTSHLYGDISNISLNIRDWDLRGLKYEVSYINHGTHYEVRETNNSECSPCNIFAGETDDNGQIYARNKCLNEYKLRNIRFTKSPDIKDEMVGLSIKSLFLNHAISMYLTSNEQSMASGNHGILSRKALNTLYGLNCASGEYSLNQLSTITNFINKKHFNNQYLNNSLESIYPKKHFEKNKKQYSDEITLMEGIFIVGSLLAITNTLFDDDSSNESQDKNSNTPKESEQNSINSEYNAPHSMDNVEIISWYSSGAMSNMIYLNIRNVNTYEVSVGLEFFYDNKWNSYYKNFNIRPGRIEKITASGKAWNKTTNVRISHVR